MYIYVNIFIYTFIYSVVFYSFGIHTCKSYTKMTRVFENFKKIKQ